MKRSYPRNKKYDNRPYKRPRTLVNASLAAQVDTQIKRQLGRHMTYRYTDRFEGPDSISFSGTQYNLLSNLVRGSLGKDNFEGDNIVPKYVQVRYLVRASVNTLDPGEPNYNMVRVIIGQSDLLDLPTPQLLLEATNSAIAPLSMKNDSRSTEYKILYDKTHYLNTINNLTEGANVFIPGHKFNQVFFTSTGTQSIVKGCPFLIVISDDGATDYPDFTFYSRVKFSN